MTRRIGVWTNRCGIKSDYYKCPKCGHEHHDLEKMEMQVLSHYKSLPVHMFCICGKDLGKLSL